MYRVQQTGPREWAVIRMLSQRGIVTSQFIGIFTARNSDEAVRLAELRIGIMAEVAV